MNNFYPINESAIKKIQFYSSLDQNLTLKEYMPDQVMSDSTKIGLIWFIETASLNIGVD